MVVYRREGRHRSVLLAIVISSLLLITIDSRGNGFVDSVRSGTRDVVAPLRNVVEDVFSPVRNLAGGVTDYGEIKEQNQALKRRLAKLEGQITRNKAVGGKVGELERLLDLPTAEDATGIAARVVATAAGNFERTVEINKGTSSGIFVGQPVVAGNGLVGKVTTVSSTTSTVTLVDAPGLGVGVRLANTGARCLTEPRTGERDALLKICDRGPDDNPLRACGEADPPDTCVTVGELVFTAAVEDGAFPPDIAVGKVSRIEREATDLEATISVRPVVDLDDITYVKVLRWPELKAP
jgi:rod shape-determining protein MreC